ncbi:MAG TPA: polymer-forming cytoskeletal protein [Longimicrobiales bacterium]
MAKESKDQLQGREGVISIIGPGMRVVGDCETEGTLRIEGTVQGKVTAGKAVVVGRDGTVKGDISTQDAVIGGHVTGKVIAESRLELQETSVVDGEIHARRIKLEEGGRVNGTIHTGEVTAGQRGALGGSTAAPGSTPAPAPVAPAAH